MKQVFLSTTTEFKEIETLEPGSWINLVNPSHRRRPHQGRAEQSDLLRDHSARNYPDRRGYHHDLLGEIATS